MKTKYLLVLIMPMYMGCSLFVHKNGEVPQSQNNPNIVIFYVDDLGYADLGSYGAKGVRTPNVDQLVAHGVKFTDAHSPAATCTPSRYSLLTGEYAFRNKARILPGDAPLLIDTHKLTLPKMLKKAGYTSAVVGKWHLGLGSGAVDWNSSVSPGPLEIGFDYSFLLPATGDRVPTVYLENHKVVNLDENDPIWVSYKTPSNEVRPLQASDSIRYGSDAQHSQTIINGVGRIGAMKGGQKAVWTDEDFPDIFTQKAIDFIEENRKTPFFLFFPFHDIHVPRLPNERFKGKSTMGPRGDAIVQMDWMTGQIMDALERLGLAENTLVIFTSDNGPVLDDGYEDFAVEMLGGHVPSGKFRGGKYSAFEAGTRVPTVVHWPKKVKTGTSDALISQVDFLKSLAALVKVSVDANDARDSENVLQALLGNHPEGRKYLLEESYTLGVRTKRWKYIQPLPSEKALPGWLSAKDVETGFDTVPQLYNISMDPREQVNVAIDNPAVVKELQTYLDKIVTESAE